MIRLVFKVEDTAGTALIGAQLVSKIKTFDVHLPEVEAFIQEHQGIQYLSTQLVGAEFLFDPEAAKSKPI